MNILDIFLIALSLSMDAFAMSLCKGMQLPKVSLKSSLKVAFFFGIFQSIMPLLGYVLSISFYKYIKEIDHWLIFFLLTFISIKMFLDAFKDEYVDDRIDLRTILILSICASIDAFAIGITFSLSNINLLKAITIIGLITFIMSFTAMKIGSKVSKYLGTKSQILGGLILLTIAFKVLFEHLSIL